MSSTHAHSRPSGCRLRVVAPSQARASVRFTLPCPKVLFSYAVWPGGAATHDSSCAAGKTVAGISGQKTSMDVDNCLGTEGAITHVLHSQQLSA